MSLQMLTGCVFGDKEGGEFPEEVKGEEDYGEGEGVTGGGDYGGEDEEGYDGMAAESGEYVACQDVESSQHPCH